MANESWRRWADGYLEGSISGREVLVAEAEAERTYGSDAFPMSRPLGNGYTFRYKGGDGDHSCRAVVTDSNSSVVLTDLGGSKVEEVFSYASRKIAELNCEELHHDIE